MQRLFGNPGCRFIRPAQRIGLIIGALWGMALCPFAASASPITFSYSGRIVDYTVPTTGVYDITAAGAQGGNERYSLGDGTLYTGGLGGLGADIGGDYLLAAGDVLEILAGGRGGDGGVSPFSFGDGAPGGGGGGSFVSLVSHGTPLPAPLVVAGGGGGGCGFSSSSLALGGSGLITTNGGNSGYNNGGTAGNGGGYNNYNYGVINNAFLGGGGGGGGGYYTNGVSSPPAFTFTGWAWGGSAFLNGGGFGGGNGDGGFGGGGGGGSLAGGGGGYSGGGDGCAAGGGGSYLDPLAIDPVLIAGTNPGNGYVTLDLVSTVPEPASLALFATDLLGFAAFVLAAA